MIDAYQKRVVLSYLYNLVWAQRNSPPKEDSGLSRWLLEHGSLLGLGDLADESAGRVLEVLERARAATNRTRKDCTARRVQRLGKEMHLSQTDVAVLELMIRYATDPLVESLVDSIAEGAGRGFPQRGIFWGSSAKNAVIPGLLGLTVAAVNNRFAPDAPLVQYGLVSVDDDGDRRVLQRLNRLALVPGAAGGKVQDLLFQPSPPCELDMHDFEHVGETRDHVLRLLSGALQTGATGVNVLMFGPPGAGKTSFCRAVAAHLRVPLYVVGEQDDEGREPSRHERLQELTLAQRLLAPGGNALVLFDEIEDLVFDPGIPSTFLGNVPGRRAMGSRVYLHRLIEEAPVPIMWCANDARSIPSTVVDRMMLMEFRKPPTEVMARIWERHAQRHSFQIKREDILSLLNEVDVSPRVAAAAISTAKLSDGGLCDVRRYVRAHERMRSSRKPPRVVPDERIYDPALIRANRDVVHLADRLVETGDLRFSLLLQGPPGSGKSLFVRYLARRLGLEVVQKRYSDLASKWVGETEKEIAQAFADARDEGLFLVFDECDSLLLDRRGAQHRWEVSQVNELLTWMEHHPFPLAFTTNLVERLDLATYRRFTFNIALDYLTPEQASAAFQAYFGKKPPAAVRDLSNATPGDFQVLYRQAEVMGVLEDATELAEMLRQVCADKPDGPKRVGFGC